MLIDILYETLMTSVIWFLVKVVATLLRKIYFSHVKQLVPIWLNIIRRIIFRRMHKVAKLFEKKKLFEKYLDLPPELRIMIIDRMQTEDRCRLTQCSKLCNKEAKASNKYIHSLKMNCLSENDIGIIIAHEKNDVDSFLSLKFEMENGKKWMKCVHLSTSKVLWLKELDNSVDLIGYATDYFIKLLKDYQSKIKHLTIYNSSESILEDYDFGIENLNNLEELHIDANIYVSRNLSKLRKPTEKFYVSRKGKDSGALAESEAIYRTRNTISLPVTKFTNEQFLRLSARYAFIHIGYLTELDIFKFIRSWQNGTIGKEVNIYEWEGLADSNFHVATLFQLFGARLNPYDEKLVNRARDEVQNGQIFSQSFDIKHYKDAENTATLSYNPNRNVRFDVNKGNQEIPESSDIHVVLSSVHDFFIAYLHYVFFFDFYLNYLE